MKLKVGQAVRLSAGGKAKYPNSDVNPYHLKGVVTSVTGGGGYRVVWSNDKTNGYYSGDLDPVSSVKGVARFIRDVEHRYHGKPIEEPPVTPEPKKKPKTYSKILGPSSTYNDTPLYFGDIFVPLYQGD